MIFDFEIKKNDFLTILLLILQILGAEDVMCWYTTGSKVNIGVMT